MTISDLPENVPIAALAGLLGLTTRQTRNLLESAEVKSTSRGQWPLAEALRSILADARRNRESDALAAARTRIVNAKAKALETSLAEKERELIPLSEAVEVMDELVGAVREAMDSIAARVTRDLELRRKIEGEITTAKASIAKALGVAAAQTRTGEFAE